VDPKKRPNHRIYLEVLSRMTPEQKLLKVFELTKMARQLFRLGLRERSPELSEDELHRLSLERLAKYHNRNW